MNISFDKILFVSCILFLIYIGYVILNVKHDPFYKVSIENPHYESFEISDLSLTTTDNLYDSFPYEAYNHKINYTNFQLIDTHLSELDSITHNPFLSQSILSVALTSKLTQLNSMNLDTLYGILQWSNQFQKYSYQQPKYQAFYQSIQSYWYNQVSNSLIRISKQNSDMKYEFKYRYLIQRCKEKGFMIGGKVSKIEKIVIYLIEQKWSYLFFRFWNNTSFLFKGIIFSTVLTNLVFVSFGIKYIKIHKIRKYVKG